MKRLTIAWSLGIIWMIATAAAAGADTGEADRTLSPYFFVETEDASVDRFPLRSTSVDVDVSGVIADVRVKQHYTNDGSRPIHARYVFPGSTRAAVHGMRMTVGERVVVAKIDEREAARRTFEAAKSEGKRASLLEQGRPNVFTMDVANIMPGDAVTVELSYTELLVPTEGTYEFVYPTVVGPRYSTLPEADAPAGEAWVQNPYLKSGDDPRTDFDLSITLSTGMPIQEAVCPTHATDITYESESLARIKLARDGGFGGDRDFILRYRLAGRAIDAGLMLYAGETENFFLLMAQPPARVRPADIPGREYIFVVDVSGSMNGFPLNTAKTLLKDLIGSLRPTDTFNVILFAAGSKLMAPESVPATADQIDRAIRLLDGQDGGGGTELLSAMRRAMALPRQPAYSRSLIVVTDGYIRAERDVFAAIQDQMDRSNVFAFGIGSSVNRYLIEGIAKAGRGGPFVVTGPTEAPDAARRFRDYVASPVLTGIDLAFDGFSAYDVEPAEGKMPDLFAERPAIVFGKWRGEPTGTITLSGTAGDGPFQKTITVAETRPQPENRALRHLWARNRISRLSDYKPRKETGENRAEIVSLGLTYNLLTAYTSFVAVDEEIANPDGGAESVKQPLPLPQGVSNLAVSGPMTAVPEPGLILTGGLLLAAAALTRRRKVRRR